MPRVSVVMPVYNVERTIADAISSVLAQTFADFELILVDDGATDRSAEVYGQFKDPRIRVIRQANRGLPGARNTGIRNAVGEFVAIIDSDDLWRTDKLARHVEHLDRRPDLGISYSASEFIDGEGRSLGLFQRPKLDDISAADVFCRNPIGNGSVPVFRKALLDEIAFVPASHPGELHYFDETFRYCEDIECWSRIALTTRWNFAGIAEPLTLYRVVSGGLSANTVKMYEYWCRMHDKMARISPSFVAEHGPRARAYQLRYYARRAVKEGNASGALADLRQALALYPRMLIEEPARTIVTAAAAVCAGLVPREAFARLTDASVWVAHRLHIRA